MSTGAKVLIGVAVLIAVIAGWWQWHTSGVRPLAVPVAITVVNDRVPYEIDVSRNQETIRSGDTVRYRFIVKQDGVINPLVDTKRYPHVAVISSDLSDINFYHVDALSNPAPGVFEFDHQYNAGTNYTLWFEINDNSLPDHNHHGALSDYIARINAPLEGATPTEKVAERLVYQDPAYILRLEPVNVAVGQPTTLRIHAADGAGTPLTLVPEIDHFYFAADGSENMYVLDHPDLNATTTDNITIKNLTFPAPGRYGIWARVFEGDETGKAVSYMEGTFVLEVP